MGKITHKASLTPLYKRWMGIKSRCYNPKDTRYKKYGAKGIGVCEEWRHSFENFRDWAEANGFDETLTLDRIDFTKDYSPSNCRWITNLEQQHNKSNNRWYTFRGETKLVPEWARKFGVTDSMIRSPIRRGKNPEEVLEKFYQRSLLNEVV